MRKEHVPLSVYFRLVDSLFGTLGAFLTLSLAGLLLAALVLYNQPSVVAIALCVLLVATTAARIVLIARYRVARRTRHRLGLKQALRLETAYAVLGVALMGTISITSSYGVASTQDRMTEAFASAMILAIGAIISSRNGGRPLIVKWQTVSLCWPYGATLLASGRPDLQMTGIIIVLFYFAILSASRTAYQTLRDALVNGQRAKSMSMKVTQQAMLLSAALDNMSTGLMMFDKDTRLLVSNAPAYDFFGEAALKALSGRPLSEVAAHIFRTLRSTEAEIDHARFLYQRVSRLAVGFTVDVVDHVRDRSLDVRLTRIEDGGFVVAFDDITERKRKDDEIQRLAHRDPLTDLHNRYSLMKFIRNRTRDPASTTTGLYVDLDGFKAVNDSEGHSFGDKLLVSVAAVLNAGTTADDVVARIGGDEFFIVFAEELSVERTEQIATRILRHLSQPVVIDGKRIVATASAGIARMSGTFDPEVFIRRADAALYEAKARGRNRWVHFEYEMEARAAYSLALQNELRDAILKEELSLVYQPVIDSDTGLTVSCEALMRWHNPARGLIPPAVFIPLAEESGLIRELGAWALHRACEDANGWPDQNLKVAVNLSTAQFKDRDYHIAAVIGETLRQTSFDPQRLEVEITESVLASDVESMRLELEAIHALGVSIALDDFGTGYSSLSYIHRLPINKVKLDRSFVVAVAKDPESIKFIASIVQMTQTLRKELVIEGVETAQELALLRSVNARIIQGYHFSRPLSRDEIHRYITASNLDAVDTPRTLRQGSAFA